MTQQLQNIIETAWEQRAEISPSNASAEVRDAVAHVLAGLDNGSLRVAQKDTGSWVVNQWIKKAVLLSFRLENNVQVPAGGGMQFYDKVPTKFADYTAEDFARGGFRVVPPAVARRGSGSGQNVVRMPSDGERLDHPPGGEVPDLGDDQAPRLLGVAQVRVGKSGVAPLRDAEDPGRALGLLRSPLGAASRRRLSRRQVEDAHPIADVHRPEQRTGAGQLHVIAVGRDGQHIHGHREDPGEDAEQ